MLPALPCSLIPACTLLTALMPTVPISASTARFFAFTTTLFRLRCQHRQPWNYPMRSSRFNLAAAAVFILLLSGSWSAFAQKPVWTPIAELLVGSLGESDPARMSDVMTRCTALNMTLAGMAADFSPEMSQHYRAEADRLIQHGVLIDLQIIKEQTGLDASIPDLSTATIEKVKAMLSGYGLWLDENNANDGSYINDEIQLEMNSCQLASKLLNHMMME